MADKTDADPVRARWTTLLIGGALMIVAGLLMLLPARGGALPAMAVVAAALVLAVGTGPGGSIVGDAPLGTAALIGVAVLVAVGEPVAEGMGFMSMAVVYGIGIVRPEVAFSIVVAAFAFCALVGLAAAVVAGIRIGRAGAVRRPWAWLPLPLMIGAVLLAASRATIAGLFALSWDAVGDGLYRVLGGLQVAGTLVLGILGVALALYERRRAGSAAEPALLRRG